MKKKESNMLNYKDIINKPELNFWIPIITAIAGIAVSWGIINTRVSNLEERFNYFGGRYEVHVKETDSRFKEQDVVFADIQVKLAEIQKDILFIKESLGEHKNSGN